MEPSIVILLGAPGAGKGTQAKRLAAATASVHVSTGDLFRENVSKGTALGREAKVFMDAGQLVPDELVLRMLFDRVARPDCRAGYVLDGFPRTEPQADALGRALAQQGSPDPRVVELVVDDAVIVERAAGRVVCANCGNIQHLTFSPPRRAGECDVCGGPLQQRKDDRPDVVQERLAVYHDQTAPLVRYYETRGLLERVDGSRSPDRVFADVLAIVRPAREGAN